MLRKILFPLILGVGGIAILLWLGVWQIQRLAWKEGILAEIDARLAAAPVALPAAPDPQADNYLPVQFSGAPAGVELHSLDSGTEAGTGYRVISRFVTAEGRAILLEQGLLPLEDKALPPATDQTEVIGTLAWPDDSTQSTPAPDIAGNIWFARDVAAMAAALETEPLLVVARSLSHPDPRLTPLPVTAANIRNNHWEYAVTWFSLAFVWAVMSGVLIFRTLRRKDT